MTKGSTKQAQRFHEPLVVGDTEKQTVGCRHTNPGICAKNARMTVIESNLVARASPVQKPAQPLCNRLRLAIAARAAVQNKPSNTSAVAKCESRTCKKSVLSNRHEQTATRRLPRLRRAS